MKEQMNKLMHAQLRESKGKLQQSDARAYKADLHQLMRDVFENLDLDVHMVQNGMLLEIPHEELGSVVVEAKFVLKPVDYDIAASVDQYEEKQKAALERKQKREQAKAADIADKARSKED